MKKRYYLSMLSLFLLIVAFDSIYFFYHKPLQIFLMLGLVHFVQRELSIGFSLSPLYLHSDSVNEYFPRLEIL